MKTQQTVYNQYELLNPKRVHKSSKFNSEHMFKDNVQKYHNSFYLSKQLRKFRQINIYKFLFTYQIKHIILLTFYSSVIFYKNQIILLVIDKNPLTMQKTISSSSYDVIVVRQPNSSYKSTPFQVAFSSNLLKNLTNKNQVELYVNEKKVDIPLRLDIKNGRITFIKKFQKRNVFSDSSDISDDDVSQTSKSRDKIVLKKNAMTNKPQKVQDYKNEKAPKPFWEFAWLFKAQQQMDKKQNKTSTSGSQPEPDLYIEQRSESTLQKIDQQAYQGQQGSKQPMFHLSLCKTSLKKKQKKEQILKQFFKRRVPYQQFIKDPPRYLQDSQLIVKIDDSLYTWQLGIAILTCRLAYGKELSSELINDMIKNKFTKSKFISYFTGQNLTKIDISDTAQKKEFTVNRSNTKQFPTRTVIRYRKNPDTQTITKMNLKEGLNKGTFILNTGSTKQQVNLKIFLWDYTEKLIISDIDGTITKSDIAGQLLNNYIHLGVTKLFTEIYKRNYKFVYLTARAIGQYNQTTRFLQTAQQDGVKLPQGPLLMSPDGFLRSFQRQVIDKTPDFLKTKMLATLNQIFPHSRKPLYCGFGNRQTDSVAYLRINMDPQKIFCITPKSVISKEASPDFSTSYVEILSKIDDYFPVYQKEQDQNEVLQDKLRESKHSVDLDDEYFKNGNDSKSKRSQSDKSQPANNTNRFEEDQIYLQSQQNKKKSVDGIETDLSANTPLQSRSKSVENNYEEMGDKIKDLEELFKAKKQEGISQFDTTEPTQSKISENSNLNQQIKQSQNSKKDSQKGTPKKEKQQYQAVQKNKVLKKDGVKIDQCQIEQKQKQKVKQ